MKKETSQGSVLTIGLSIGVVAGTAVGLATHNLGLWIGLGVSIGAAVAFVFMSQRRKKGDKDPSTEKA
jgi:hypothetical protein